MYFMQMCTSQCRKRRNEMQAQVLSWVLPFCAAVVFRTDSKKAPLATFETDVMRCPVIRISILISN